MTTHTKRPSTHPFVALTLALTLITSLRAVVARVRRRSPRLARQIEDAASSVAANLGEGNRRQGRDRRQFFLIAAGSADETRCHLLVAQAWGWVAEAEIEESLALLDRELAMLWKLTH
ncbi:MAG: four helix bundle protein [Myxococcales bacterium]|jgi:four helix bundle protein